MGKLLDTYGSRIIVGLLVLITLAVFWQVLGHQFVNYDDNDYVTDNRHVRAGLTASGIAWAFASLHECNWHPLTWISHMADFRLSGSHPIGHHLTGLLIHLLNVLLLYHVLRLMTGSVWRSGFVAALFAIHPLHVESVAWVSERKDVLSTMFWMLTILAYVHYSEFKVQGSRFKVGAYISVIVLFALGLMAKPMLVTLPIVLLLLDYWPLGRVGAKRVGAKHLQETSSKSAGRSANALPLLIEKLPLFALSIASSIITYIAQQAGQSVGTLERFPLWARIANAFVSYLAYIGKMIVPVKLAVFYPHPGSAIPMWKVLCSIVLLAGITVLALRAATRRPYLAVGWLWYLVTLIPVIGFVQVGWQAMADRYTYVPLIGLFIMIGWGVPELVLSARPTGPTSLTNPTHPIGPFLCSLILGGIACLVILALAVTAWKQTGYWKDSFTLFRHALRVTKDNAVAHNNLGLAYANAEDRRADKAIAEYEKALEIEPGWADGHDNLGVLYLGLRQLDRAEAQFRQVIRIAPQHPAAHNNLGAVLLQRNRLDEAVREFRAALKADRGYARAHINLGTAVDMQGKADEALRHYSDAVKADPSMADAHYNLGLALAERGKTKEAIKHCEEAVSLHPNWPEALNNLAWILATQKKPSYGDALKAIRLAEKASEAVGGKDPVFLDTLAAAYAAAGRWDDAMSTSRKALSLSRDPQTAQALAVRLRYYQLHQPAPY